MADDTCLNCSDNFIVSSKCIICSNCKCKSHWQCAGLKDDVCKLLAKVKNLKWFCDKCLKNTSDNCEYELLLCKKESECAIRENDLMKKIVQDQEYTISLQKEYICSLQKNDQQMVAKTGISSSYSDIVKTSINKNNYVNNNKNDVESAVLIVKSKTALDSKEIEKSIKSEINPRNFHVNNIKLIKNGVMISCDGKMSLNKLKTDIQTISKNKFSVSEMNKRNPRIKVVNADRDTNKLNVPSDLIHRNGLGCNEIDIKVVKILERKSHVDIILEVLPETRAQVMSAGHVYIGWRKCPVVDHVNIIRCFKCWRFNHFSKDCQNSVTCKKCASNHMLSDCKSESEKCINCISFNLKFKTKLCTDHPADSNGCEVFKQKLDNFIKSVNYVT